ncbi:MAG: enoyl-CoA hydratase/isomerase family protein [Myxococcales bacterium]|nr:enoyl-CoA hydratase/isomerase family protein [Myxococcales bacterium]
MPATATAPLPVLETVLLKRDGRLLTITLDRPEALNAFDEQMHQDLVDVLAFVADDPSSDVLVLTGAGRAFSAGGDLAYVADNAHHPERFDADVRRAKRIVYGLLDLDKPIVCRLNGHAIGLGATLALLCDIIFAAEGAKIGDPHVSVGLVAGDGGAFVWPQRIGHARAKEYLLTGDPIPASTAAEIGLINHCVPASELDGAVDAFCQRLLAGSRNAIRWTKVLVNLELKRIAHAVMDPGIAYEAVTVRSADHRAAVEALLDKRTPSFHDDDPERER